MGGEVRGLSCAVSRLRTARIIFPKHLNDTQSLEGFFIGCATHQPWRLSGDGGGVGEEVGLGWGGVGGLRFRGVHSHLHCFVTFA